MIEKDIVEKKEKKELGKNVEIVLVYMRHGLRDLDNFLTDPGRKQTKTVAEQLRLKGKFDIVKPYGSSVGPHQTVETETTAGKQKIEMGRSLETAVIFGEAVLDSNQKIHNPRQIDTVNYQKLISPPPYNHQEIYKSFIPSDYDRLSDQEKEKASNCAQKQTVCYLMALTSPEAIKFKKELAGAYALPLAHFTKMSKKIESNKKILIPLGGHGGHMEMLLQQAMRNSNNNGRIGFKNLDEIGGEFDSSEGYFIKIKTDSDGNLQDYTLTFFDKQKRPLQEFILDAAKVEELVNFYKELHQDELLGLKLKSKQ